MSEFWSGDMFMASRKESFRRSLRDYGQIDLKTHPPKSEEGEVVRIAKTEVITVTPTTPISDTIETMARGRFRRMPITSGGTKTLEGIVTATDIIDYFGGGQKFDIITEKYGGNFFKAINEAVKSIMNRNVVTIHSTAKVDEAIDAMVKSNVGVMPIVDKENRVRAILTERDIVNLFANRIGGATVSQLMSTKVVSALPKTTLFEAEKTMVTEGFRRLPILSEEKVVGMLTAMDIISFFASGEAFRRLRSHTIMQVLNTPALEMASKEILIIQPNEDVGKAAKIMQERNIGSLPVVKDNKIVGILTERDFFKIIE